MQYLQLNYNCLQTITISFQQLLNAEQKQRNSNIIQKSFQFKTLQDKSNSMGNSPSWEAVIQLVKKFPPLRHKSPKMGLINILKTGFFKIYFNILLPLCKGLRSGIYHSSFPSKILYAYLICPNHPPWFDLHNKSSSLLKSTKHEVPHHAIFYSQEMFIQTKITKSNLMPKLHNENLLIQNLYLGDLHIWFTV